jgi:hypothetical protein
MGHGISEYFVSEIRRMGGIWVRRGLDKIRSIIGRMIELGPLGPVAVRERS